MTLRLAAFAAAAFLIAQPTLAKDLERATPESTGLSKVEMDKLKAAMAQIVASGQRAGIVYAVAHKGKLVALEAIGKRDLEKNLPMEVDTQFHLASLSRVLSGGTILSLVDEGKLKMSDPVSKYIPEFAQTPVLKSVDGDTVVTEPQATPLTVRHLFTYTGGFSYGDGLPKSLGLKQSDVIKKDGTLKEGIETLAKFPLVNQPGAKWHYGFSGDVLGRVAEVASGQQLDEFMRTHLTDKLGMKDTGFYAKDPARLAAVYTPDAATGKLKVTNVDQLQNFTAPSKFNSGGGGMVSTVPDYIRFGQMLANGGTLDGVRVLKAETVKAMLSRQTTPEQGMTYWYDPERYQSVKGYAWGYAIGVRVDGVPHQVPGSSGDAGWAGFTNTWFFVDPKNEIVGVAMSQLVGTDPGAPVLTALRSGIYLALGKADALKLDK